MLNFLKRMEGGLKLVTSSLVLALALLMVATVFFRYVLNKPIQWSDEISRLILVWITFLGAALATKSKKEIIVDVLDVVLTHRMKFVIHSFADVLTLIFMVYVFIYGLEMSEFSLMIKSDALRMPYTYFYAALPIGAFITIIYLCIRLVKRFQGKDEIEQIDSEGRA